MNMCLANLKSFLGDHLRRSSRPSALGPVIVFLVSCGGGGGGTPVYTVSATVSGLQAGKSLVLSNNGANSAAVSANGTIAFTKPISSGGPYSVTVATQPTGESCAASLGSGTVSTFNVNVAVACSVNAYSISATVSGLRNGNSLVLQNNGTNDTTITANAAVKFSSTILSGSAYAVTVSVQPPGQNCTVANGSGTVGGSNVSGVTVSCSLLSYTVGVNVLGLSTIAGLVLQDNGGDNLALQASGAYVFNTPVSSGSPYAVTILAQPTAHTCIVTNPNGTVTNANVNVTVICPENILYAVVTGANAVSAYYIDATTGSLTAVGGSPFATGTAPGSIVLAPNGRFCYVINGGDKSVSAYSIDPITGALSSISGSPYAVGSAPVSITVTPNGSLLLVLTAGSKNVTSFAVNASTGALSATPVSPLSVDFNASYITTDPTGNFAYTTNRTNSTVSGYAINNVTGALTPIANGTTSTGTVPVAVEVDPKGGFLYVANLFGASVSADTVDSTTGALAPITGSPFSAGYQPVSLGIDSAGRFLYAVDAALGDVLGFSINASTGVLVPIGGSPFTLGLVGGGLPRAIALDPSGKFAYVASESAIVAFTIDATTGALVLVPGGRTASGLSASVAIGSIQ